MKKLNGIFEVTEAKEHPDFNPKKYKNKKLLWHGSRVHNFQSILKTGLKIAPANVPHTAFLFGRGVYFADFFYKAA